MTWLASILLALATPAPPVFGHLVELHVVASVDDATKPMAALHADVMTAVTTAHPSFTPVISKDIADPGTYELWLHVDTTYTPTLILYPYHAVYRWDVWVNTEDGLRNKRWSSGWRHYDYMTAEEFVLDGEARTTRDTGSILKAITAIDDESMRQLRLSTGETISDT